MEKDNHDLAKEVTPSRLELEDVDLALKMRGSELNQTAREAAYLEHSLGPWAAIKAYPMAIFWALMVSMCTFLPFLVCLTAMDLRSITRFRGYR